MVISFSWVSWGLNQTLTLLTTVWSWLTAVGRIKTLQGSPSHLSQKSNCLLFLQCCYITLTITLGFWGLCNSSRSSLNVMSQTLLLICTETLLEYSCWYNIVAECIPLSKPWGPFKRIWCTQFANLHLACKQMFDPHLCILSLTCKCSRRWSWLILKT